MTDWDGGIIRCLDITVSKIRTGAKRKIYFEVSDPEAPLVHLRSEPAHNIAEREPLDVSSLTEPPREVAEAIYAGPIWLHFGHFIAECVHRLHAAYRPALADLPIFFHRRHVQPLPDWTLDIFSILQIDRNRIEFIDQPTRFGILHVPTQGRLLNGRAVHHQYRDLFPPKRFRSPTLGPKRIYVSRSRHRFSGSYLGESYVEEALAAVGFTVIYPEAVPVGELVNHFENAESLIFAEGSAIHVLEICGRIDASVFVIGRRTGVEARFSNILEDLVRRHAISLHIIAPMGLPPAVNLMRRDYVRGCPFVDLRRIFSEIEDFFGIKLGFDNERAKILTRLDLIDYLLDQRSLTRRTPIEVLGAHLMYVRKIALELGI